VKEYEIANYLLSPRSRLPNHLTLYTFFLSISQQDYANLKSSKKSSGN